MKFSSAEKGLIYISLHDRRYAMVERIRLYEHEFTHVSEVERSEMIASAQADIVLLDELITRFS